MKEHDLQAQVERLTDALELEARKRFILHSKVKRLAEENEAWEKADDEVGREVQRLIEQRDLALTDVENLRHKYEHSVRRVAEVQKGADAEKNRRLYYQTIVYSVCNILDVRHGRRPGTGIQCGTVDSPSEDVQREVKKICEDRDEVQRIGLRAQQDYEAMHDALAEVRAEKQELIKELNGVKRNLMNVCSEQDMAIGYVRERDEEVKALRSVLAECLQRLECAYLGGKCNSGRCLYHRIDAILAGAAQGNSDGCVSAEATCEKCGSDWATPWVGQTCTDCGEGTVVLVDEAQRESTVDLLRQVWMLLLEGGPNGIVANGVDEGEVLTSRAIRELEPKVKLALGD